MLVVLVMLIVMLVVLVMLVVCIVKCLGKLALWIVRCGSLRKRGDVGDREERQQGQLLSGEVAQSSRFSKSSKFSKFSKS